MQLEKSSFFLLSNHKGKVGEKSIRSLHACAKKEQLKEEEGRGGEREKICMEEWGFTMRPLKN